MDPITFSIIRHRLFRVVDEAVITLKHVSGSAITNEGHDLMVSLYRADGSLLMGGVGFLHHLTSAAEACKAIIRRFEGDINEGDIFLLNDPYTAALHTSDIYLVSPIHHEGRLVAWSACFVHVYDIGAMNPGGFAPDAQDIYTEGFSSPGIRLVEKGALRQDVMDTLLNMVRSPEMVTLDMRSMIACNNVARDRMLSLIGKYGYDTVDAACQLLIDQSEELLRQRLAELPDGQWQSRQYLEVKDEVYEVLLTMTKKADELVFDFTGSSPQAAYSVNCTKWASLGGLFAPLFPLLCYDITWNEGVIRPITMIAPEGSIVNCTRPAPVSVATVGAIQSVNNAACSTIGKMLEISGKYREEATAVWHANHFAIFKFGRNQHGREAIGIFTETFAGSGRRAHLRRRHRCRWRDPEPDLAHGQCRDRRSRFPDPLPVPPAHDRFRRAGQIPRRRGHGVRGGAARCTRRRHPLCDFGQGRRFPDERRPGRRLSGRAQPLCLGPQQRGRARQQERRYAFRPVARRDAGRAGVRHLGRVPIDGRGMRSMSAGTAAAAMAIRWNAIPRRCWRIAGPAR